MGNAEITISIPNVDDLAFMVKLGNQMRQESLYKNCKEYDEYSALDFGLKMIALQKFKNSAYIKTAKNSEGIIIGMIVAEAVPYMFSPSEKMIVDHLFYVAPEYRGSSAALRMFKDFERWAISIGANEISLGVSTGVDPERTDSFYKRMGYLCAGGIYKKYLREV